MSTTGAALALDQPPQASRGLWLVAAAAAFLLHLGCVLFVVMDTEDDSDLAVGAPALAIDVDLAAPNQQATDLPAGPDAEATMASPQIAQQQEVLKQSDLPKDTPTETDDPDRLVALDNAKKLVDNDPDVKPVQTAPSAESAAQQATATPSLHDIPESVRSTAPVLGTGDSARKERVSWQRELGLAFSKNLRYPATRASQRMEVLVTFEIDRLGRLLSFSVVKSSGSTLFDEAALAMLKRADPLPPPPPAIADEGLTFTVPVEFKAPK